MNTDPLRPRRLVSLLAYVLLCQTLTGCDQHSNTPRSPTTTGQVPAEPPSAGTPYGHEWHGPLSGAVTIGAAEYAVDGLVTVDNTIRIRFIGIEAQFIGHLIRDDDSADGNGVLIAGACAIPEALPICDQAIAAHISVTGLRTPVWDREVVAEIRVQTSQGEEVWSVTMWEFGALSPGQAYLEPAALELVDGPYVGSLAGLLNDGDVTLLVEGDGRLSLESAAAGCAGNGTLAPHFDGRFNAFDVKLTIEGCSDDYGFLNGEFEGLATHVPLVGWATYSSYVLRIWLSTPEGAPIPGATTIVAYPEQASIPLRKGWQGYFSGTVSLVDGRSFYSEALLTVDGDVRIHIGGYSETVYSDAGSAQFVGHVDPIGGRASGSGVIIGQGCASHHDFPFCTEIGKARISIVPTANELSGEIQITSSNGSQTWLLAMGWPTDTYLEPATFDLAEGLYQETLTDFARHAVIRVDDSGQLFFEAASSGCTANGNLSPHLDGKFNVYDVRLLIENCNPTYTKLNGYFEGLATRSMDGTWDYYWGDWLVIWASSSEDSTADRAAISLWGSRL